MECPKCENKLKKITTVWFSTPHGLTIEEFKEAKSKAIRYDCKRCNRAWLFFPEKIYYWQRPYVDRWMIYPHEWRIA